MKHVLIADEGCWLTRVGFTPEQESAPEFWKEVRTSEPEDYTEVTDTLRTEMEDQWRAAHPEQEASPEPEPWGQCTDEEKTKWEQEHPSPEPGSGSGTSDNPEDEGYRFDQMPVEEAEPSIEKEVQDE